MPSSDITNNVKIWIGERFRSSVISMIFEMSCWCPLTKKSDAAAASCDMLRRTMIQNFREHAANERTFLAWVRTAIAVMAFGFLVERFDLFLEVAMPTAYGRRLSLPGQKLANITGPVLILLGIAMVAVAAIRFLMTAKNIDRTQSFPSSGARFDLALAALLMLLGSSLFIYLSHALVGNL